MRLWLKHVMLFLLALFSGSYALFAQADTLLYIQPVEISEKSVRLLPVGSRATTWTADQLKTRSTRDLSELLATQSNVYIKSYGLGSLATSSIRGGSAGHTLVLWNGLPIQSPMLGQLDLSLLPLGSFGSVRLIPGGNSSSWGSGAIGGLIHLRSQGDFNGGYAIESQTITGDFGRLRQRLAAKVSTKRFFSSSHFEYTEAENDFSYPIAPDFPERKQSNAKLAQRLFTQDLGWKLSEKNQLTFHLWHQDSDREIPPTNVQNRSLAFQEDEANRVMTRFIHEGEKLSLNLKGGYFDEDLRYADPMQGLDEQSRFRTYLIDLSAEIEIAARQRLMIGHTQTLTEAESEGYAGMRNEHRLAVFGTWFLDLCDLQAALSFRQEFVDGEAVIPVPSLAFDYELNESMKISGKLSRNFRLPTLNDRYWRPGGNPELNPESGWSQEFTFNHSFGKNGAFSYSATGFHRNIENWILWSPASDAFYWSALNVASVRSRGLEFRLQGEVPINTLEIKFLGGYDYIISTPEVATEIPGMREGEQLLFTPRQTVLGSISLRFKGLALNYTHRFVDETQGANGAIPEFQIADLRLEINGTSEVFPKLSASFFIEANNVYDSDYFIIDRRPMPGRNFMAGIQFFIHHQKSTP